MRGLEQSKPADGCPWHVSGASRTLMHPWGVFWSAITSQRALSRSRCSRQGVHACMQVKLAVELRKPLFLHCRDAADALARILAGHALTAPAVVHCFTGSAAELARFVAMGLHIGITGWVGGTACIPAACATAPLCMLQGSRHLWPYIRGFWCPCSGMQAPQRAYVQQSQAAGVGGMLMGPAARIGGMLMGPAARRL